MYTFLYVDTQTVYQIQMYRVNTKSDLRIKKKVRSFGLFLSLLQIHNILFGHLNKAEKKHQKPNQQNCKEETPKVKQTNVVRNFLFILPWEPS